MGVGWHNWGQKQAQELQSVSLRTLQQYRPLADSLGSAKVCYLYKGQ